MHGMHTHPVARVYAQALLDLAGTQADAIGAELEEFLGAVRTQPDLGVFFATPALDAAAKRRVLESLRGSLDDLVLDFLCVVVGKGRAAELEGIGVAYGELADAVAGRVRIQVASAVPLADAQRQRLLELLQEDLQHECVLEIEHDPALIGGLVLQIGDRVYEGSVHGWLQRLRKQMVRSSGYED